jgi:hypothetical protein
MPHSVVIDLAKLASMPRRGEYAERAHSSEAVSGAGRAHSSSNRSIPDPPPRLAGGTSCDCVEPCEITLLTSLTHMSVLGGLSLPGSEWHSLALMRSARPQGHGARRAALRYALWH